MTEKVKVRTRGELFVERVAWNAAAGAALAVMLLILLWSLQWLDRIAPGAVHGLPPVSTSPTDEATRCGVLETTGADRKSDFPARPIGPPCAPAHPGLPHGRTRADL